MTLLDIPEIQALDTRQQLVRIPPQLDVPLTPRIQALIDTAPFRRLAKISQLGLVSLVYPAANHTRFEHSLGTYRLALLYLKQLSRQKRFTEVVTTCQAETLIVAALLHDLGHWPYCHPLENLGLPGIPSHERCASKLILEGPIARLLERDWTFPATAVTDLLSQPAENDTQQLLRSILSGPIDVDKMDYLERDSLHAGVPYGNNFDKQRLIGSLCVNERGDGLAVSDKGRTAAELMVFARYVMFSEVYWHHAVRSATAMLQRAFFDLFDTLEPNHLFELTDTGFIDTLIGAAQGTDIQPLVSGLFGPTRQLYKRLLQFSHFQENTLYSQLARRPYPWLVRCGQALAELLEKATGLTIPSHQLLFDAPPVKLEVQFKVQVHFAKENLYRSLGDVSPVVQTLAREQFDDYVKRVRLFIHPDLSRRGLESQQVKELLPLAIQHADATS